MIKKKFKKSQTRMTDSILKRDPNTQSVFKDGGGGGGYLLLQDTTCKFQGKPLFKL